MAVESERSFTARAWSLILARINEAPTHNFQHPDLGFGHPLTTIKREILSQHLLLLQGSHLRNTATDARDGGDPSGLSCPCGRENTSKNNPTHNYSWQKALQETSRPDGQRISARVISARVSPACCSSMCSRPRRELPRERQEGAS